MGLKNIRKIASNLVAHGRSQDTPVAVISRGKTEWQRTVVGTLETIADLADQAGVQPPVLTVIGEVVNLRVIIQAEQESSSSLPDRMGEGDRRPGEGMSFVGRT